MIYQNIFSSQSKAISNSPTRLKSEAEDFDFTQTMMENFILLEEAFYGITREHMMATHLSMKEDSIEILQEGFKDFANSAVEFFKKMLAKFKEFMANVFMVLNAYLGNFEKFINKYKDKLNGLDPNFTVQGYEYTFNTSVPNMDKINGLVQSYNGELEEVLKMTKEEIIKNRDQFTSEEQLDSIRAYVLGHSSSIPSDDFIKEAKSTYRSGASEEHEIHIKKSEFSRYVNGYKDIAQTLKDCKKERDRTIMLIESLKEFFSKSPTVHYKGKEKVMYGHKIDIDSRKSGIERSSTIEMKHSDRNITMINVYYSFKLTQAKELGSICITAVTEKVNALKEAVKLYEKIVRKGLFNDSKKEGSDK